MPMGRILARFWGSLYNAMTYWAANVDRISVGIVLLRKWLRRVVKSDRYGNWVWCWCVLCVA
jgi:hypothetical protein